MSLEKSKLKQRILDTGVDGMAVMFWFDILYARHEKNPKFTEEDIYQIFADKSKSKPNV